ncbi:uncharacterized protein LOC132061239 [Lycium ferocissimum]|uniref:uncharacterized protein LOC132061239 n=1 Tax=Lycium ferocissimum TaxID=112874 RepID=UPI002815D3C2|nr:uncharacterized protein LOC132061239 [Lycium ferocissimum]
MAPEQSQSQTTAPATASDNIGTSFTIDASHPLYVHPSDNSGIMLVPTPFSGFGYNSWKRNVLIALSAKNKAGLVNGRISKPSEDAHLYDYWVRSNDMVFAWLSNSLSKDIAESVLHCETARDIWKDIEERYGQSNDSWYYQIQREITKVSQGDSVIASHFTRLRRLWDELRTASFGPECTCGAEPQCSEGQKLIKFLTGLNDSYSNVRSNILMINPVPTLGKAYSMLLHDEKQREIQSPTPPFLSDSTSLIAKVSPSTYGSTSGKAVLNSYAPTSGKPGPSSYVSNSGGVSGTYASTSGTKSYSQRVNFDHRKPELVCKYCKRPSHSVDKCYRLHGFPADFKFTKNKKSAACVQVNDGQLTPNFI